MTDKQRLEKVYKHLINKGISDTKKGIAEKIGYSSSYISQVGSTSVINETFVSKLVTLDENLNKVWILTGQGEMLLAGEDDLKNEEGQLKEEVVILKSEYIELKKQISELITTNMNLSKHLITNKIK